MKNWTIAQRISFGFVALLLVTGGVSAFAFVRLSGIKGHSDALASDCMPGINLITQVQANLREDYSILQHLMLTANPAEREKLLGRDIALHEENVKLLGQYETTIYDPEDRALYDGTKSGRTAYLDALPPFLATVKAGKRDEAYAYFAGTFDPAYRQFEAALQKLVDFNRTNGQAETDAIASKVAASKQLLVFAVIGAAMGAAVLGFILIRDINRTLRTAAESLNASAQQVAAASSQVSSSSQSLASGASEQAASLEETSASLEEMASMTKRNADSAGQAKDLSGQTRVAADTAAADMDAMKSAMDQIKASSGDISKIIKTIDDIAFQTNILALNAAVEAARAGEAGMGFAVVAEEVRALAQRSAQSARETADKIAVAVNKSEQGVAISTKVAHSLGDIVGKARNVDALVGEIAAASTEQNDGIAQVNRAVGQMDKVTQSNASTAEETAAAAEELSEQARVMRDNVADLMRLVGQAAMHRADERIAPTVAAPRTAQRLPAPAMPRRASGAKLTAATRTPDHELVFADAGQD